MIYTKRQGQIRFLKVWRFVFMFVLARDAGPVAPSTARCKVSSRGTLFAVGSRVANTLLGVELLRGHADVLSVTFDAANPADGARMIAALEAGTDVVISLAPGAGDTDPSQAQMLARAIAPVALHAGALAATGRETAAALRILWDRAAEPKLNS